MARPRYKPAPADRDTTKRLKAAGWSNERIAARLGISRNTLEQTLAVELEFGADEKQAELMAWAEKAAKKGSHSAIKWLAEKYATAAAAQSLVERGQPDEPPAKVPKLGKREQRQVDAAKVGGLYAPPAGPGAKPH